MEERGKLNQKNLKKMLDKGGFGVVYYLGMQIHTYDFRLCCRFAAVIGGQGHTEDKKTGGNKNGKRNFNETAFGGGCSFRTSDKKMEP